MSGSLLCPSTDGQTNVGRVLRHCPRVRLQPRKAVAAGDLPAAKVFVIEQGFVLLTAARPGSRRRIVLSIAGAGAVLPPLAPEEQLAGLTKAVVVAVPAIAYGTLLALPGAAAPLVEGLLDALCERQESLATATGGRHAERLRAKLYQLARLHGRVGREGIEIELPLTHELLAQMIGSARETVTCTIAQFQRDGILVRNGHGYRLTVAPATLESSLLQSNVAAQDTGRAAGKDGP